VEVQRKVWVPGDYVDSDIAVCIKNWIIFHLSRRAVIRYAVSALAVVQCRAVRGLVLGARAGCQVLLWKLDAMLQASTGKPKDTGGMVRAQTVSAVVLVTALPPQQRTASLRWGYQL
jgi:hypothetical protein